MKKQDLKLAKLKELFMNGEALSVYDIETILEIKKSQASKYLSKLKSEGVISVSHIKNRISYYTLTTTCSDESLFSVTTKEDVYKYLILINLYEPMSIRELYKEIFGNEENESLPLSSFYNIVERMIKDKTLLTRSGKTQSKFCQRSYDVLLLYPSGRNTSLVLTMDMAKQTEINFRAASGMPGGDALNRIYQKIAVATGNTDDAYLDDYYDNSLFIQYGRGYKMNKQIHLYYTQLLKHNFQTNALSITYNRKRLIFSVGLLVYSQDKDKLYIMGHQSGTRKKAKKVLRCDKIEDYASTNIINNQYDPEEYIEYIKSMFSMPSLEKVENVEVIFDNTPGNLIRLKRLKKLRVNASLEITPEGIIYKDDISGMEDFRAYLRSFGYRYKVISPDSLKKKTLETLQNTLKRYE